MDRPVRKMGTGARGGTVEADAGAWPRDGEDGLPQGRTGERTEPNTRLRLLRFPAVRHMTGLSRSTIWRLERAAAFPRHVRLSANTVAWLEDEVRDWIRQKLA